MCLFGYEEVELDEPPPKKEEKKKEPQKGDHVLVSSGLHVQPIVSQVRLLPRMPHSHASASPHNFLCYLLPLHHYKYTLEPVFIPAISLFLLYKSSSDYEPSSVCRIDFLLAVTMLLAVAKLSTLLFLLPTTGCIALELVLAL